MTIRSEIIDTNWNMKPALILGAYKYVDKIKVPTFDEYVRIQICQFLIGIFRNSPYF